MATTKNKEISEGYHRSGLTRRAYAQGLGISEATLGYHLKRAAGQWSDREEGFARLEVGPVAGRILVTTPGGTTIEIPLR